MTTTTKSPTDQTLDSLALAQDAAESAMSTLYKHSTRLTESHDADEYLPVDAIKDARLAALDLVEAAQSAGKALRRLEQLEVMEPCS